MLNEEDSSVNSLPEYAHQFLKEPPELLTGFHYEDIEAFLILGTEERFVTGDVVLREEDRIKCAYLIGKGSISVWKDNIELAVLGEGDILGETFLFNKFNKPGKIQSEGDSIVLKFERYEVLNYFRRKPEKLFNIFTKNIIDIQQKKINNINWQLVKLKKRLLETDKW